MEPTNPRLYNPRIDQLRAVGFLAVVAVHFFCPVFNQELQANPITAAIFPLIANGYFGVSLFFFISGYILSRLVSAQGREIAYGTFLLNRLLRIYPVWLVCVAIVMFTFKLSGAQVIPLLALFTQDVPPPFKIAWSVQTEMYLYLAFPLLFAYLTSYKRLAVFVALLLAFRATMHFLPMRELRDLSYSTVFGAMTIFAVGLMVGRTALWNLGKFRWPVIALAVCFLWLIAAVIESRGGFASERVSTTLKYIWLFYPEIMAGCFLLLVRAYDSAQPSTNAAGRAFAFIGKISYSGYMFHTLVMYFFQHSVMPSLQGVYPLVLFVMYLALLLPFSYASYKVIEEPFLLMRKRYVRRHLDHVLEAQEVEGRIRRPADSRPVDVARRHQ